MKPKSYSSSCTPAEKNMEYLCQEILRYSIKQIFFAADKYELADVTIEELRREDQFKLEEMLAWLRFNFGWKEDV